VEARNASSRQVLHLGGGNKISLWEQMNDPVSAFARQISLEPKRDTLVWVEVERVDTWRYCLTPPIEENTASLSQDAARLFLGDLSTSFVAHARPTRPTSVDELFSLFKAALACCIVLQRVLLKTSKVGAAELNGAPVLPRIRPA
jgi:hypothetical protein